MKAVVILFEFNPSFWLVRDYFIPSFSLSSHSSDDLLRRALIMAILFPHSLAIGYFPSPGRDGLRVEAVRAYALVFFC